MLTDETGLTADELSRIDKSTISEGDKAVLKNLSDMGLMLKNLRREMLNKEAEYEQAKKEYEYYASSVLPMEMFNAGVEELKLTDGSIISRKRNFYCTPNKNDDDRRIIAEWLRKHGGDELVKEKAQVDKAFIDKLKAAGLPYTEIDTINTQSLKAFIVDKLGVKNGIQQIQVEEIPDCVHFYEVNTVEITS